MTRNQYFINFVRFSSKKKTMKKQKDNSPSKKNMEKSDSDSPSKKNETAQSRIGLANTLSSKKNTYFHNL